MKARIALSVVLGMGACIVYFIADGLLTTPVLRKLPPAAWLITALYLALAQFLAEGWSAPQPLQSAESGRRVESGPARTFVDRWMRSRWRASPYYTWGPFYSPKTSDLQSAIPKAESPVGPTKSRNLDHRSF